MEILSASECGLLSMYCLIEKVSITEFAYLVTKGVASRCEVLVRLSASLIISRLCRVGRLVGSYCLKIREDC